MPGYEHKLASGTEDFLGLGMKQLIRGEMIMRLSK